MKNYFLIAFQFLIATTYVSAVDTPKPPNIIVIFCDDLGFADLSSYGSIWNQTPEIDQMAVEGLRFTNFYAGAPVCTPSRAGLMTGCYARRVDMDLDAKNRWVLFPVAEKGINPKEITLPEVLKAEGYSTAIFGKWHLGDQPEFFPTRHGFDYWFGLPYSNDMEVIKREDPPLPLMRNDKIIQQSKELKVFDQSTLTKRYTDEAIQWIDKNKKKPFFLYLAHTMPHNPVAARSEFYSRTVNPEKGFGASVAEISWSTGEILSYLRKENLDENTLVIFTSDNGGNPHWGASNGILKGKKGQTTEGGIRVPCIAWWPGKIKPGTTCNAPASVIDFYATFSSLANIDIDSEVKRDGMDISQYFFNPKKEVEPRPFYYWHVGYLEAVRYGNWKLNLTGEFTDDAKKNIANSTYSDIRSLEQIQLYDLYNDPGETVDVSKEHPEIVHKLLGMAEKERIALGEWTNKGPEVRETLYIKNPQPLIKGR
ncbi:sulfatase [Arenibacter sp. ARW7G5Y1]|uniref:sulfatase family protein n=1 Tax=Arenibacter sp. ARW7G5Y1 TaxID=2135619 RepID=UPI000D8E5A8C|nr:sulfatase [Arenibacter sp. ARW7G5Y1]PXX28320.1 arylsulfatase A-like enzyme [Arenibacter sp. ARW7G5Y1]